MWSNLKLFHRAKSIEKTLRKDRTRYILERRTLRFSSYKNRELKVKL